MSWHQLSVTCDEQTAFDLSDFFSECGAVSVTYMDAEDQPVYEPAPGETKIWRQTRVIALFELDSDPKQVKAQVQERYADHSLTDWTLEQIEDQAWERAWLEHFKPLKFSERLWVCPTGQEIDEAGTVCMTLDPGLAFGTGTHPTTALCLEWLASHDLNGKTVIDYGCGSGILAVAALLLGARQVHCIDIDPQALEATYANAEKNNVTAAIQCYLPEDFPAQPADIVLANILAGPLIELSANIAKLVDNKGFLVLSGILKEQSDSVIQAYQQQGLKFSTPKQQEDWCRLDGRYVHPMSGM
jgi:ribosomal protein L11 methyltransferase